MYHGIDHFYPTLHFGKAFSTDWPFFIYETYRFCIVPTVMLQLSNEGYTLRHSSQSFGQSSTTGIVYMESSHEKDHTEHDSNSK